VGVGSGLGQEQAALVLDRVLAVHGAHLSHAMVDVDSGGWLATEELPASARTAAARLRQLDADAQRGASRYQRARTRGLVRLDPAELEQVRGALAEAGLSSSSLVPRRIRTSRR